MCDQPDYEQDDFERYNDLEADDYAHEGDEEFEDEDEDDDVYDHDDEDIYGSRIQFADPGGNSALRAATASNPRNCPCPTCDRPNRLTPEDVRLGYQCDACADAAERGGEY